MRSVKKWTKNKSGIRPAAFQGKTAESYANVTLILRLLYAKNILLTRENLSSGKIKMQVNLAINIGKFLLLTK